MAKTNPTVALFAKFPLPGLAKTRLVPELGEDGAADLHRRLVERTLATVRESGLPFEVWTTGAERGEFVRWLGPSVPLVEQGGGDLGDRLERVTPPTILLGADVPDLAIKHLSDAAAELAEVPVVIGPAADGGYYLLGFREPVPFLFADMRWGTDAVLEETLDRLRDRRIEFRLLDTLRDCDRPEDLAHWPDLSS